MNNLLKLTADGNILIDNEFFLYEEFNKLPKNKIQSIAKYIYLTCNPSSNIYKWEESQKIEEALNQTKLVLDDTINKAVEKYKTLLTTPALVAINTANKSLHTMTKSIAKIDEMLQGMMEGEVTFDSIKIIQDNVKTNIDIINKLPNLVKTLQELEEKYKSELDDDKKAVGSQRKGFIK